MSDMHAPLHRIVSKGSGDERRKVKAREGRESAEGRAAESPEQRRRARVRPKTAGATTPLSKARRSVGDDLPDRQELEVGH